MCFSAAAAAPLADGLASLRHSPTLLNVIVIFRRGQKLLLGLLAALGVLVAARGARADDGDASSVSAQRLEHLLAYLAADYGGAVAGGVVTNEDEHKEHVALASEAERIAARLPAPPDLRERVARVRSLVERAAPEKEIATPSRTSGARSSPPTASPRRRARPRMRCAAGRSSSEHCSTCHGHEGQADTPRAAGLTPRPANFHDPQVGEALTPFRVASTIRFGINGTAMMPFTFLYDADRWDLAFHRHWLPPHGASRRPRTRVRPFRALASLRRHA